MSKIEQIAHLPVCEIVLKYGRKCEVQLGVMDVALE
jgi:hypothetical protein